ncbi:MAG TPA: hypothetical protein VJ855_07815 [Marinilabiliaceae bacterium]|nr:hypothetical protein [Marinilabiliaceae bacterium]
MKFVISRKNEGVFQFLLKDTEDRPVLWSPRYPTKSQCKEGIDQLRQQIVEDLNFDKWRTESGRYVFHLKSNEGRLLAMSAPFISKTECSNYISKILNMVGVATEEDLAF